MSLRLLHYSDIENACDEPARIGRLARALEHYRDEHTIVAGTGDNTAPGVLPMVTEGRQSLEFFEAVSPDIETFGNHDFDFGVDATRDIVAASPQTWISANVHRNGSRFGADLGVEPWTLLERNGVTVGCTGVTTPRTASLNPMATELSFSDPVEAVSEAAAELRAQGADIVVVCSHLGRGDDDLARAVDVDVILGGHVASQRSDVIDGTLLTRPGDGGTAITDVAIDPDTLVPTATIHQTTTLAPAPAVVETFEALRSETGLETTVASVDEPLDRSETTLFGGESRVGNFVADAYRWKTGADVGLQNSGGLRTGTTLVGDVTVADMISLVPFDEPVAVAAVSGQTLQSVFEEAAGVDLGFAEPNWWHAQVSGVTLEWDPTTHDVAVQSVGGAPFEPEATYQLATSSYLFHTDDEFPSLERGTQTHQTELSQYEILAEYARECGIDPSLEGRVQRIEGTESANSE